MHGELECKGNVQQLCASRHWRADSEERKKKKGVDGEAEVAIEAALRDKRAWEDSWNVRRPLARSALPLAQAALPEFRQLVRLFLKLIAVGRSDTQFVQCMNYGETHKIGSDAAAKRCASVVGRGASSSLSSFSLSLDTPETDSCAPCRVDRVDHGVRRRQGGPTPPRRQPQAGRAPRRQEQLHHPDRGQAHLVRPSSSSPCVLASHAQGDGRRVELPDLDKLCEELTLPLAPLPLPLLASLLFSAASTTARGSSARAATMCATLRARCATPSSGSTRSAALRRTSRLARAVTLSR